MFKEYGPDDYVFTDENGVEYISTPEYPIASTIATISLIFVLVPILMSLIFLTI